MPLLEVENLYVDYPVRGSWFAPRKYLRAVDDVSFTLDSGETLGLVGESGCGKSTVAKALVRLETPSHGVIRIAGRDIAQLNGRELRGARKDFQMVFQDPYGSLNPRLSIRYALEEVLVLHTRLNAEQRLARVAELLHEVGLDPAQMSRYPHQFSGGQRQRIGIARALAAEPKLLIADEPVSALDVSVQASIINLLEDIQKTTRTALLFIAHDLAVVEHVSDRIMVMYLGRIVESAPSEILCAQPLHPYTAALLSAVPTLAPQSQARIRLAGDVPSPLAPPTGCAFHPRCPFAQARCRCERPILREIAPGRRAACFFPLEKPENACEKQ